MNYPDWWDWELEFTPHIRKRMVQRDFSEVTVREMWDRTRRVRPDVEDDRWVLETANQRSPWEIVVEPDPQTHTVVVITAYPVE